MENILKYNPFQDSPATDQGDHLISILLIDDDEEDYLITRDIIEDINHQSYTVDWVPTFLKGQEIIKRKEHDVYIIDYRLGIDNGLDLLKEALEIGVESPIILLTGLGDIEIDQKALSMGATDYLAKSELNPTRLERSIRYGIQQAENLKQIRLLNQELEKRVEVRTEALAMAIKRMEKTNKELEEQIEVRKNTEDALRTSQQELAQALKKEKELNEMKSRFVSMASHEFRTPLGTILSSINILEKYRKQGLAEKGEKHFARVKSAVRNLNGILNDFLSVDKLEEGHLDPNPIAFDLSSLLEEVAEEIQASSKPGQKIRINQQGECKEVVLDPQFVRNILINLLSNAVKYSPAGSLIQLSALCTFEFIRIEIQDEGIGIPEEEQKHLFERFFRANNATNIQGTGLGLHIVKRYVALLEGEITFQSKVGKGTIFQVQIPLLNTEYKS
ncbi:MAG: hybrid sensor histidine kinase/response regulator [Bacteroidota bacterium]